MQSKRVAIAWLAGSDSDGVECLNSIEKKNRPHNEIGFLVLDYKNYFVINEVMVVANLTTLTTSPCEFLIGL